MLRQIADHIKSRSFADFSGASVAPTQVWFPPIRSYVKIGKNVHTPPEL